MNINSSFSPSLKTTDSYACFIAIEEEGRVKERDGKEILKMV